MAKTFTSILLHVVFSTKNRADLISPDVEADLWNYLAAIVARKENRLLAIGGTANHVHLLISMGKGITIVDLMEDLKKDSSKWIKTKGAAYANFYWQEGYGAFSIGESGVEAVKRYLRRQKEHHRRVSFEDEFRRLLDKYRIEYDERYLW